jgi:tRNA pseudouridine55 synthase
LLGCATKACDILPDSRKAYTAGFRLGLTTDTQDITGTVLTQSPVTASDREVEAAALAMRGDILQVPPMYSAVRVGGRRLYDLAREGKVVERVARPVTVEEISLRCVDAGAHEYELRAVCSKGTYIRTLCHDIGGRLGCGAVLTSLRRTMAAGFTLERALTIPQAQALADGGGLPGYILPVETLFAAWPAVHLDERRSRLFHNGVPISLADKPGDYAVYGSEGFLGVASAGESGAVSKRKLFLIQ